MVQKFKEGDRMPDGCRSQSPLETTTGSPSGCRCVPAPRGTIESYLKAENEFSHAFKQMNYWKSEADRLNGIAAEALRELESYT